MDTKNPANFAFSVDCNLVATSFVRNVNVMTVDSPRRNSQWSSLQLLTMMDVGRSPLLPNCDVVDFRRKIRIDSTEYANDDIEISQYNEIK